MMIRLTVGQCQASRSKTCSVRENTPLRVRMAEIWCFFGALSRMSRPGIKKNVIPDTIAEVRVSAYGRLAG